MTEAIIIIAFLVLVIVLLSRFRDLERIMLEGNYQQLSSFTGETARMREGLEDIQEKVREISLFQENFRSPKLKGQWGEASLENNILHEYFPSQMYECEHLFKSGERVDAVLKLPDGHLLPIDSKFPWDDFRRMTQAETEGQRKEFRQLFLSSAKRKIDDISRKYILPSEGTTDMAMMYIPAETVYYELINNTELSDYARRKKVVIISPNTAYLALATISTWRRSAEIGERTKEILRCLEALPPDWERLADSWRKVGVHLRNADLSYQESQRRLEKCSDKVQNLFQGKKDENSSN